MDNYPNERLRRVQGTPQTFRANPRSNPRTTRRKEFDSTYEHYVRIDEMFPEHLKERLIDMPNNKGYIFRGCWYFGRKPEEKNSPLIMFEKRGPLLLIHEITKEKHIIYEKYGHEPKQFLSETKRRRKVLV